MKKWLMIFAVVLIAGIALIYLNIPNRLKVGYKQIIAVNSKAFSRKIIAEDSWEKWWPGQVDKNDQHTNFKLNGQTYQIAEKKLTSLSIIIKGQIGSYETELVFIPAHPDSVLISWEGVFADSAASAMQKIRLSAITKSVSKDMALIVQKMQDYYHNEANVYGLSIVKDKVKDSTLISTAAVSKGYPSADFVYGLIEKLRTYTKQQEAVESGLPMLHVLKQDSSNYKVQVALPVNKKLADYKDIHYKWMLGGGNILIAEVSGGPATISNGFKIIEQYIEDHHRVAPAIQFESLITNRQQETDTTKWITKLYWPVM